MIQTINAPSHEHPRFDQICAGVDDFEPLPAVDQSAATPFAPPVAEEPESEDWPLDGLILSVLVSPY